MNATNVSTNPSVRKPATGTVSSPPRLEVCEWRPYVKNTLRAFCSLGLPSGMIVHGCTFHERNGSRWVGLPAKQYEKDGATAWTPVIEFSSKEARDKFQSAALAAVDAYHAENRL